MIHELKTWPEPFQVIMDGLKTFEIRRDDRGFQVGDKLLLRECHPNSTHYTGREAQADVVYILRGFELQPGAVAMQLTNIMWVRTGRNKPGFGGMDPDVRKVIAAEGAMAAKATGKQHRFTKEEAKAAGRKGGRAIVDAKGVDYMRDLASKGGSARWKQVVQEFRPFTDLADPMLEATLE